LRDNPIIRSTNVIKVDGYVENVFDLPAVTPAQFLDLKFSLSAICNIIEDDQYPHAAASVVISPGSPSCRSSRRQTYSSGSTVETFASLRPGCLA
jgi:hypothetical protein